jgi:hypothetical protein
MTDLNFIQGYKSQTLVMSPNLGFKLHCKFCSFGVSLKPFSYQDCYHPERPISRSRADNKGNMKKAMY